MYCALYVVNTAISSPQSNDSKRSWSVVLYHRQSLSTGQQDFPLKSVNEAVGHSCSSSPWIDVRTPLTCSHVSDPAFVPQVANSRFIAAWRSVLIIALKGLKVLDLVKWSRIPHPLDCLPWSDEPHILHLGDGVKKQFKPFFMMRRGEPCWVVI